MTESAMEVVVITGAISHVKLESNHHQQQTNFKQAVCPSCHSTNSVKALNEKVMVGRQMSPCLHSCHKRTF